MLMGIDALSCVVSVLFGNQPKSLGKYLLKFHKHRDKQSNREMIVDSDSRCVGGYVYVQKQIMISMRFRGGRWT